MTHVGTLDPLKTTDVHYSQLRVQLYRYLLGKTPGENNWLVYTRLKTTTPTLINFAFVHLEKPGPEVNEFVERVCELVDNGKITKEVSELVSGDSYICNAQSSLWPNLEQFWSQS